MIKAIFFDIDGTLVSFQTHTIPNATLTTLQNLQAKGIKLFIATGRSPKGLDVLQDFPFDGYITLNGQYVYTNKETLYANTIDPKDIVILLKELESNPFPCGFEMITEKIYNYRSHLVDELHQITHNDGQPVGDINNIETKPIYQLMAFIDENREKDLMTKMTHCESSRWHSYFCDISPLGGTKALGMDILAKHFGFTKEETMSFGDGGNDIQLLQNSQISIAMGNAVDSLKEIATYTTDTIDNDGITKALQHFHIL